ncbi:MAG: DUF3486 family protein [Xanthomonadaceae bacterium]|nr:DUF3486 family protein [Xanthomonadaceae bacterium]MDP2185034.1 DUF3486 family protein [Xanthomonadales bacterium]MDZ4114413.1 phage protein Gp27 family protein [Xanthomonadaceae bacterium]
MARRRVKSSISRLPIEQREHIERLIREGRMTLDEMIADLQTRFPGEPAAGVSRSALHRFDQRIAEVGAEMREIETAASALVGEFGEGFGEKSTELLSQAITTLAIRTTLKARDQQDLAIDDARKLARMAKDSMDTRRMSLAARQAIEQATREKMLREQKIALENVVKSAGLTSETADALRRQILGIAT